MDEILKQLIAQGVITQEEFDRRVEEEKKKINNPTYDYTGLSLEDAKSLKIQELNNACDAELAQGFIATVNGHHYETKIHDQINFLGLKNRIDNDPNFIEIPFRVEDLGYQIIHTREEFLSVFEQGFTFINGLIAKCNSLKKQVIEATTVEELKAIQWD